MEAEFWPGRGGPRRLMEMVKLMLRTGRVSKGSKEQRVGNYREGHELRKSGEKHTG